MEWLKSLLASWKVRVAIVGGAVVVASAYGTCSFDPTAVSSNETTTGTTTGAVEVSASTTTGTTSNTVETTEGATTETTNSTTATTE